MTDPRPLRKLGCFALGLLMAAVVWRLDRLVASQASVSIFFLLPICFVAWFCGGAWAYAMSFISAAAWLQADLAEGRPYAHWFIPYWNAGVRLGFFVIVTVLSGLIAKLRRLNDRERETSELKSRMVTLVSHEFGNFLTTFRLSLTVLRESDGTGPSAERERCYATLDRVYTHLSGAVANFLNLNRIESGKFVPRLRPTTLRTLVHATISQMGPLIEHRKVELRLDFPAQPVAVKADPDALSVILSNVIGNAFKYTPDGGSVTVRVVLEPAGTAALLAVEDTGIGIPAADLPLVSSGHFRAEAAQKEGKGFGVGLKVAHALLESQGASLKIESAFGRGSRVSFLLPLWTGPEPLPSEQEKENKG